VAARDAGPFRPAARPGRRGKNLNFDSYFNFIGSWWHGRTITNKQKLRLSSDWWYPRTPYHPSLAPGQAGGDSAAETWGWVPKMRPTRPKKGKQGEHRVSGPCRGPNNTPGPPTGTQCVALTCQCTPRGFLWGVSPAPVWPSKSAHGRGNFYR
jgi:hypothetical protein